MKAMKKSLIVRVNEAPTETPSGLLLTREHSDLKRGLVVASGMDDVQVGETVLFRLSTPLKDGLVRVSDEDVLAVEE